MLRKVNILYFLVYRYYFRFYWNKWIIHMYFFLFLKKTFDIVTSLNWIVWRMYMSNRATFLDNSGINRWRAILQTFFWNYEIPNMWIRFAQSEKNLKPHLIQINNGVSTFTLLANNNKDTSKKFLLFICVGICFATL